MAGYNYAVAGATPLYNPDLTYASNSSRFDSSATFPRVVFSTTATPLLPKGTLVYNTSNGTLRFNTGTAGSPNWRPITIG